MNASNEAEPVDTSARSRPFLFLIREWPYLAMLALAVWSCLHQRCSSAVDALLAGAHAVHRNCMCDYRLEKRWASRPAISVDMGPGSPLGRCSDRDVSHLHRRRQPNDECRCPRALDPDAACTRHFYCWRSHHG